ncbi:unnamed protein product [Mortierella alpina]
MLFQDSVSMTLPKQDHLLLAKTSTEAAQGAKGTKGSASRHYRTARNALATVLDNSKSSLKRKASKSGQRAGTLRQKLDGQVSVSTAGVASSLAGPGSAQVTTQARDDRGMSLAGIASSSSSMTPTARSVSTSSAPSIKPSPTTAGSSNSAAQQLAPPTPQTSALVSASTGIRAAQAIFCKDVSPIPYSCELPGPNVRLHSTRQLAYCLAVLQASAHEHSLSWDELKWRESTLVNENERIRLETLAHDIVLEFAKCSKDADEVAEVLQLAPVLNSKKSRRLLQILISTIAQPTLQENNALTGLAKAVRAADPGSINSGDLVKILKSLHGLLGSAHSASHRYFLLLTISQILDAMADAHVGDVDSINLYGPLKALLQALESSKNPYLTFQAAYAAQALLNVSSDENIWQATFRRLWLVLKGGAGFAKMPDPTEVKDALEALERFCAASKGGLKILKDALEAIKAGEHATFTVKDGLLFRRAWYSALRAAETYIQSGKLVQFKEFVTTVSCRDQLKFQWGICQLLGQFAADTQWDLETRKSAIAFLGVLYRTDSIWKRHTKTDQVIFDALTTVVSNNGPNFEVAKSLLQEMKRQITIPDPTLEEHSQLWNITLSSNLAEHATTKAKLLVTVQDRQLFNAKMKNLPDYLPQPQLEEIQQALKAHYESELNILRLSGERLSLETCFVNLAIVEAPAQREQVKHYLKEQAAVFHRMPSFEKLEHTNTLSPIPLKDLFEKRKLCDGKLDYPRRILVQGRAGIGKTTLCKMIVHECQTGTWRDRFDAVLWLPLRRLKLFKIDNLQRLFRKMFFIRGLDEEGDNLARALCLSAQQGRVLFILDGLDEVVSETEDDEGIALRTFLRDVLFAQRHVVITSRPSGLDRSLLPPIDLELETMGFNQENVSDYVATVLKPKPARTVLDFIRRTPTIQGLANIPVQLDIICYSWDSLPNDGQAITMTGLYQLMVWKLCCKDVYQLKKHANGVRLTVRQINQLEPDEVDDLMTSELIYLEYLAFKGLANHHQIELNEDDLRFAFRDLKKYAGFDSKHCDYPQTWYFLHLTFQEYFAAAWIARHLHVETPQSVRKPQTVARVMTMEQTASFIQKHKYNPQYEIVWWMVAGLLQGEALRGFFDMVQGAPRDLIGSRHQQVLAACLHEARARLNSAIVATMDWELREWLRFEMQACRYDARSCSKLGSQTSFPEAVLLDSLNSVCSWKPALFRTLGTRSFLSASATEFLTGLLQDEQNDVRSAAASALGKKAPELESAIHLLYTACNNTFNHGSDLARFSALLGGGRQFASMDSAWQSYFSVFKDEQKSGGSSAASSLANQSTLSESTVESLIAAMVDGDRAVGEAATQTLGTQTALQEAAIQTLTTALRTKDWWVKTSVASVLSSQSILSETTIQSLATALGDRDECVRSPAAKGLYKQRLLPEIAIHSLVAALKSKDGSIPPSELGSWGKLPPSAESVTEALTAASERGNSNIQYSAALMLGKPERALESPIMPLLLALEENGQYFHSSAAAVLAKQSTLSEPAIESLIDALRHENEYVRFSAASALANQSNLSESVLKPVIATLLGENRWFRFSAASVLSNQSELATSAIESLTAALKDEDEDVRSLVASVLGSQPTLPNSATHSLITALTDSSANVRDLAASALAKQSSLSESTIELLLLALKNDSDEVRRSAALAFGGKFTLSDSVLEPLISLLRDDNGDIRKSATSSLGMQSTLSESAIQTLNAALEDDNKDVKFAAASVLDKHRKLPETEQAIRCLSDSLDRPDWRIKASVASALVKYSRLPDSAINFLINQLKDENKAARKAAASALENQSMLSEPDLFSLLLILVTKDYDGGRLVTAILDSQSSLPDTILMFLAVMLTLGNKDIQWSVATTLSKRSPLPVNVVQALVKALTFGLDAPRNLAASVLGSQSTLPDSAILSLIEIVKGDNVGARQDASELLLSQCASLCTVLQYLSGDEIARLYRDHLFRYSCSRIVSLQVVEGRLCMYTEQGLVESKPIPPDQVDVIESAFRAVQHEAGIYTSIVDDNF